MENETFVGNPWDSMTNIVLFILVAALIVLTFFGKIDPRMFETAVTLVLGYFFTKGGHKDGEQAAIRSAQASTASAIDVSKQEKKP